MGYQSNLLINEDDMKKLRIHYFKHVVYEGLGSIEDWISSSGHKLTATRFFENAAMPELSDIDMLIIMGGGMSVNDEEQFPWLASEKKFIKKAVEAGKIVLGICLGSQLVSSALGAKVYRNKEREIGWFDIELTSEAQTGSLFHDMGRKIKTFHWHGETFDLPKGAILLASSAGCKNQAYIYKERVLALQCHFEPTPVSLLQMIDNGRDELKNGEYIQTEEELFADKELFESNRTFLFTILTRLADQL
jgi:GMP synthase-like glutamine amidotransferase